MVSEILTQREQRFRQLECLTCTDWHFPRSEMTEFDEPAITKLVELGHLKLKQHDGALYAFMQ